MKSSAREDHRFLCLTGVIFDSQYVGEVIQRELEKLKGKYFHSHPDDPVILHRKEILYKQYAFTPLKNPELETAFNDELIE